MGTANECSPHENLQLYISFNLLRFKHRFNVANNEILLDTEGTTFLRNVGAWSPRDTVSYPYQKGIREAVLAPILSNYMF